MRRAPLGERCGARRRRGVHASLTVCCCCLPRQSVSRLNDLGHQGEDRADAKIMRSGGTETEFFTVTRCFSAGGALPKSSGGSDVYS